MENKNIYLMIFLMWALSACSKVQFSTTESTTTTTGITSIDTTTTTATTTTTTSDSACSTTTTVPFSITSVATLSDYAGRGLNNPINIYASINLVSDGNYRYYGSVQIGYSDLGVQRAGVFTAPAGNNVSLSGLNDNGEVTAKYNYFYGTGQTFSGFFQDTYGAIVVSITNINSNGCADGKIYYKNFVTTAATNVQSPYRKCWFITAGPYQCGSSTIQNKSSLVPSDGYTLLGSFTGLPARLAFQ